MTEDEKKNILKAIKDYSDAVKKHEEAIEALKELGIVILYEGDKEYGVSLKKGLPKLIEATGREWHNKKDCIGYKQEKVREITYKKLKFHQEGKMTGELIWE